MARVAGHFLHLLHDKPPSELHQRCLDTTLILYAEHEFNASTFTGRVITGTLSDFHSAVTGAIGALRGPLHGGANEAAMELIEKFKSAEDATKGVHEMLARKEKIMGFGHRVYTTSDPRNAVNKKMSKQLAEEAGDMRLYEVSEAVETVMWDEKKLFANADFFAASVYHFMGIPTQRHAPSSAARAIARRPAALHPVACSASAGGHRHEFEILRDRVSRHEHSRE